MKTKLKTMLLLLLTALAAMFVLVGCSLTKSLDEIKQDYGITAMISYYANGEKATFTPDTSKKREIYYKAGQLPLEIKATGTIGIKQDGYEFNGWYYIECDGQGNPIFLDEAKGTYKLTDDKVDFSAPLQEGDHWHIGASWLTTSKVFVSVVHEDKSVSIPLNTSKIKEGSLLYGKQSVGYGETIYVAGYDTAGELKGLEENLVPVLNNGYTFVEYYKDEACTETVKWPLQKQDEDQVVYAKYITGAWTVVKNSNDVKKMFGSTLSSSHYWILNDIDCSGISVEARTTFACEIQGNGHTLSNLKVKKSQISATTAMFGEIRATAKIENISFVGLELEFSMKTTDQDIYFVFTSLDAQAVINNVSLQGRLKVEKSESVTIPNLSAGYSHCLYGGYATDEEYLAVSEGKGFTVEGNPEQIISVQKATGI